MSHGQSRVIGAGFAGHVEAWIVAAGEVCVRGEVVAVQLPEAMRLGQ